MRRRLRIISVLLIAFFLLTSALYLIWDNNKSSFEPIEIDKDFLQKISDRLPMPEERTENENTVKIKGFKGIIVYYTEPVTEQRAEELNLYFREEEQRYQGSYIPLNGELSAAFAGNHYYSSIVEKLGYGWFNYKGNLYADYYNREKAEGKPNYRNRYDFSFVKNAASYNLVIFTDLKNPEKALSGAADYISAQKGE